MQCLSGLRAIHTHKILHRDIKAQNVLITGDVYKIADFGVSKVTHSQGEYAKTQIGTPFYLSPEIWRQEKYNEKTDVYSLGCLFYELCMLKHPYNGKDIKDLQKNVLRGQYQPITTYYSEELRDMIYSMLRTISSKRPSIAELIVLPAIQAKKDVCPTLFDDQILAGEQTVLQYGMNSYVDQPEMLKTIQMN